MEIDPILLITAFTSGYLISRWQCHYYWLINMSLRTELIGSRRTPPYKRKLSKRLPRMLWWAKAFIGFLKRFFPGAVSYNQFHPGTVNAWAKKLFLTSTYISLLKKWAIKQKIRKDRKKAKKLGRPSTPEYIVDIILSIKKENLRIQSWNDRPHTQNPTEYFHPQKNSSSHTQEKWLSPQSPR